MKTTNDDCVGIRGNNTRFSRGETHESKQRRLYIYQRAAPSLSLCSTKPLLRPAWRQIVVQQTIQTAAHMYTECTVLFSLAQGHFAKPIWCRYLLPVTATVSRIFKIRETNSGQFDTIYMSFGQSLVTKISSKLDINMYNLNNHHPFYKV